MNWLKAVIPAAFAAVAAGCSFTGGNAPISEGPTSTTIYTVKPGDTLYAIARRYSLDPTAVARENSLDNPSQLLVGQKLRLTISSGSAANISRVAANQTQTQREAPVKTAAASSKSTAAAAPVVSRTSAQSASSAPAASSSSSSPFMWPADGSIVENFGTINKGIDIAGKDKAPILASAKGTVVFVGTAKGYGNLIIIRHDNNYVTAYGRIGKILVKQGQTVSKGALIGEMSASAEKGARVHFEIRKGGKPQDPTTILPKK